MLREKKVLNFDGFKAIFEGGAAIKSSRRIREDEFPKTLEHIRQTLFPLLDIDPTQGGKEYLIIGSIGKKADPSDTSGDLDIGYDGMWFAQREGIQYKECSKKILDLLSVELATVLGFEPEIKYMPGLNIVSIGWPIEGDMNKGIVQVDLIPLSDMKWAEFIYYSPDYKKGESKYKSAHRNWFFSAVLSARKKELEKDEAGEILDYDSPVLILSDGLYWHTKSYKGKLKPRLKHSQKIPGSERFVTNDPQEFIDFALGKGYRPEDVKSFEDVFKIVNSPSFDLYDKLPEIKERYIQYLDRVKLPVPIEINQIS
jgi:hypothetical protein